MPQTHYVIVNFIIDEESVWRHPFPGPGLAIRYVHHYYSCDGINGNDSVIGAITKSRLDILRQADAILTEELVTADIYRLHILETTVDIFIISRY